MRVDDSFQQRLWHEPEDSDVVALRRPTPETVAEPAAPAAEAEAPPPFWAAGTPVPPSTLNELPPAAVATTPAAAAPAPGYVGEAAVDATWLASRETALVAVRHDYEAARAQALASGGAGPGWQPAQLVTDESGQPYSATGATLVHISDPNAQPVLVGYDEGGPVYQQPAGQWLEFNEEAFAAHYRAQGGAPLQTLAASYGTDAATLLAQHPGIWGIATSDHAINAGPAPAGRAMGDPAQLGMLDLYMADPQVAGLIDSYGGSVAPASSGLAQEQVRVYGQARYEQLTKLGNAMQSVRDQYTGAMAQAQAQGGPGWVERPRTVTVSDESGATSTQTLYVTDESGQPLRGADGQPQAVMERYFDPDAFTAWYVQQGGQQHEAFASFYGQSHTQYSTDESGQTFASSITFDNPNWSMVGAGGGMAHNELRSLDLNNAPRLNDNGAIGFDLEAGWATHHSNIHQKRDWFETVVTVALVAVVSYVTAGAASGWAAAAGWGTTATAVAAGAAAGAAGSLVSGAISGNLAFKDILRGALAGGLSGGLLAEFGATAASYGPAGTVALRTTVQGGIQALLGGSFKDGAIAGFASGLADVTGASMQAGIDKAVAGGTMSLAEAATARTVARVLGSAIRAAGNPDDPGQAFASAFLGDVIQEAGSAPPPTQTAFDDDGNLMPGIVDPTLPPDQQAAQLQAQLQAQGLGAQEAALLAAETVWQQQAPTLLPPSMASQQWSAEELQAQIDDVERALQRGIDAQLAREDSLLTPEDLLVETGGPGGARGGAALQPVLNRGFDAAMNAAADVAGLLAPLQQLQGDLARLQSIQAEGRLGEMRQAMRSAGMNNVPDDYVMAWDANGNIGRDYRATAERLTQGYNAFLADQRLRANWGPNYESLRIGRSQMTAAQFETRTLQIQQAAATAAYDRGVKAIAAGELALKNGDYVLTLGTYVDQQVRFELRRFGTSEGIPDSGASSTFAVNRQIRGADLIGIPDLRLGQGLLSDVTLSPKDGFTDQLRRWNTIRPNDTVIIRPDQLGGSYVVPRSTIRPIPGGRGG